MRSVTILGCTGSVGTQALDVISRAPGAFCVRALAGNTDDETVASQVRTFDPDLVAMADPAAALRLEKRLGTKVGSGPQALLDLASDPGCAVVCNAVVGAAGLRATLAALAADKTVALANKESCVAGGPLVRRALAAGGRLVPVDSEHASAHMCLAGEPVAGVRRLLLTASGGPFRGRSSLDGISVAEALSHPTWSMGPKITIDSATLMNKGLEIIEANVLFGLPIDRVEVVVHPQSIVHCLVEFADGSWKASLSPPDMRVPIAYALGWPERIEWGAEPVDWTSMRDLTFEAPDTKTFRCLALACEAGRRGGTAPAVLNAANEVAVQAFLQGQTGLAQIADVVEEVLDACDDEPDPDLDAVLAADSWARRAASEVVSRLAGV